MFDPLHGYKAHVGIGADTALIKKLAAINRPVHRIRARIEKVFGSAQAQLRYSNLRKY